MKVLKTSEVELYRYREMHFEGRTLEGVHNAWLYQQHKACVPWWHRCDAIATQGQNFHLQMFLFARQYIMHPMVSGCIE
jgi:hypothetical protein